MRSIIILAALAAGGVEAATCQYLKDIKPVTDPFLQNKPDSATFPCDMGSAIPLGKVPTGCAKFEIIVGQSTSLPPYFDANDYLLELPYPARGTSEPGDLGVIVGDPLVARVKRDMPGIEVRGYPVQVSTIHLFVELGIKILIISSIPQTCLEPLPGFLMSRSALNNR